jgi:aryl-alcohol dehydrogenase-like predicted oxidoreductase
LYARHWNATHKISSRLQPRTKPLQKRTLGVTGFEVTGLGYGSMGLRGPNTWGTRVVSDDEAGEILHAVLDAGINFIDTSPDYGLSEERIGRFISSRRHHFYLATKCGCDPIQHADHLEIRHVWSADVIRRNVQESLRRLRTDYIDLLQFHGGNAKTLQENGLIDLMHQLSKEGLIRHFGVSSSLPELAELIDLDVFATYQLPYSCLAPEHTSELERAAATGAGIIVRGGVARGGPAAVIQRPETNAIWNKARLDDFLVDGMTPAQLILRYTVSNPNIDTVIVGTCDKKHLIENIAAFAAGVLSEDIITAIRERVQSSLQENPL